MSDMLNEGYKLTHHEIMALFNTIEKGDYTKTAKMVNTANAAKDYASNIGNSAKNMASTASSAVGGVANKTADKVGGFINRLGDTSKRANSVNSRVEPTLNDSVMYEGWLSDTLANATNVAKREIGNQKPVISAVDLTKMWKNLGSPTDSDEIVRMLTQDVKMSKAMVLQAMKTASSSEPNVVAFADLVKRSGLSKQIIAKCDTILSKDNISKSQTMQFNQNARTANKNNVRDQARNKQKTWGESIGYKSPISEKMVIPDAEIKDIITQMVTNKIQNGAAVGGTEEKVHDWATKIKQTTDAVAKMALVKEIVNFLADVHGTDEWKKVVHGVDDIIKTDKAISDFTRSSEDKNDDQFQSIASVSLANGKKMEKKMFLMANDILTEAGLTWTQLSLKPTLNGQDIVVYQTIKNTDTPIKQFMSEMIMYKANKEILTIGRAKKI